MSSPEVARDEQHETPWWARRADTYKRLGRNFYLVKDGTRFKVRFEGPDPLSGEWVKRSKLFPSDTPLEEIEGFVQRAERFHAIYKIVRKHLSQDERWPGDRRWSRPFRRRDARGPRGVAAVKWKSVPGFPGIKKSEYGWIAHWCETDSASGARVPKSHVWKTNVPPGPSEPPPEHVTLYREQRKREGLEGKQSRRKLPKKNLRAMHIALPAGHPPPFAVQFRRLLKEARLSLAGAATFFDVGKATIRRHLNGHPPTPRLVAIYEEKLSKRRGRPVSFVL